MSHKSLTEKLLAARFRELAQQREDKLPDEAPPSLQAEVLESIEQVENTDDVDKLLNVGSTLATANFLDEVVEPETDENKPSNK